MLESKISLRSKVQKRAAKTVKITRSHEMPTKHDIRKRKGRNEGGERVLDAF